MLGHFWVERLFRMVPIPYPLVSIILALILLSIYGFLDLEVSIFKFSDYYIQILLICFLVAYQLAGIQYLINNIRRTLEEIKPTEREELPLGNPYQKLERRLDGSSWYYIALIIVFIPFLMIDMADLLWENPLFSGLEYTIWSFLLDIYNYSISYLDTLLLATNLWIILNLAWMLDELGKGQNILLVRINVFNADKIGGLRRLKDLIIRITIYYFLLIALIILSYITPSQFIRSETIIYIIFILIGVGFFFISYESIREILGGRMLAHINNLDTKYDDISQNIFKIISKEDFKDNDKIQSLSTSLDVISREREKLMQINTGYDITSLGAFISSILVPVWVLMQKILESIH